MSRRAQTARDPVWGAVVLINEDWTPLALRRAFAGSPDGAGDTRDRVALGRAARELDARLRHLHDVIAERELEIWRGYLGRVVTGVSPLLLRACDRVGAEVDELVERLRPGMVWEHFVCGPRPGDMLRLGRKGSGWSRRPARSASATADFQEYAHGGLVACRERSEGLVFGLRVLNRNLEVAAYLGDNLLRTHGRSGSLTLRGQKLGATLRSGLPGIELERVVDHWLLQDSGAMITSVEAGDGSGAVVRFSLAPVPWRVPWARADVAVASGAGRTRRRSGEAKEG